MYYWLPGGGLTAALAPTFDLLALIAIVVIWGYVREGRWPARLRDLVRSQRGLGTASGGPRDTSAEGAWPWQRRGDRWLARGLTTTVVVFMILGFGQGIARREFGYDLVLALQVRYVPEIFRMMYDAEPLVRFLLYCGLLVGALVLLVIGTHAAVRALYIRALTARSRRALLAGACAYAVLFGTVLGIHPSLSKELVAQVSFAVSVDEQLERIAVELEGENESLAELEKLGELDSTPSIYVFVIESYGAVVFRDQEMWGGARDFMDHQEAVAHDAGYGIRSGYLDVPVFGGSSWMAQATMLCGATIGTQDFYDALFLSNARCIPEVLNRAGYRTAVAAANITFIDDGYERLFPFDAQFFRDDLGYKGMRYGWSFVPDQYVIEMLHRHEVLGHPDTPRFIHYKLTNSHHPWDTVPPYIEDWSSIGDGSVVFSEPGPSFGNRFVRGDDFRRGYWETVAYSMRTVFDYLDRIPEDDALIVVLGDHQPRRPVAEMDSNTWWTPIHVMSRDEGVLQAFTSLGYAEGITPPALDPDDEGTTPAPLAHLFRHIFEAYAGRIGD